MTRFLRLLFIAGFLLVGGDVHAFSAANAVEAYRRVDTVLSRGRPEEVRQVVYMLQQREIDPFVVREIRYRVAAYDVKHRRLEDARRLLLPLSMENDSVIAPRAILLLAELELAAGNLKDAADYYEVIQRHHSELDASLRVFEKLQKATGQHLRAKDLLRTNESHFDYLRSLLKREAYEAVDTYGQFMASDVVPHYLQADVSFYRGIAKYFQYDYFAATPLLQTALGLRPGNQEPWPRAFYYLAQSLRAQHEEEQAAQRFLQTIQTSKEADYVASSYYELSRYYQLKDHDAEYEATILTFSEKYPNSLPYLRLKWENQWDSLRALPSSVQARTLRTFYPPSVYSRLENFYGKLGGMDVGIRKYPMSFYVDRIVRSYFMDGSRYPNNPSVQYLNGVYRAGYRGEAMREAGYQRWKKPDALEFLYTEASFLAREGKPAEAMRRIRSGLGEVRVAHGHIPHDMVSLMYPRLYWNDAQRFGRAYGVDPYLIVAIMRAGSFFDPKYHSEMGPRVNLGRRGVMQISPKTGWEVMIRQGRVWTNEEVLYQPRMSIDLATFYFAWLLKQFDGRLHEALAAYHQDPVMAKEWSKKFGSSDFNAYVSKIPYLETRDYIRRVMDDYMVYRMLYN